MSPGKDRYPVASTGATVTLLHGRNDAPPSWDKHFASGDLRSRQRNAISIIAKLEFHGRSVLFTGDSVGLDRYGQSKVEAPCVATEQDLVQGHNSKDFDLASDVLIAPHHGSSNGSCLEFIKTVSPRWTIFASGNGHRHPTKTVVSRYLKAGIATSRIFRTDRGDNEGGSEWKSAETLRYPLISGRR